MATPTSSRPVTAAMTTPPEPIPAGETFEIHVHVAIAGGYHIYARVPENSPFSATALKLTLPPGVEALDDWKGPEPVQRPAGECIYTDSAVVFRRRFRVVPTHPVGALAISGEFYYQACDENLCRPPATLPLSGAIHVTLPDSPN